MVRGLTDRVLQNEGGHNAIGFQFEGESSPDWHMRGINVQANSTAGLREIEGNQQDVDA